MLKTLAKDPNVKRERKSIHYTQSYIRGYLRAFSGLLESFFVVGGKIRLEIVTDSSRKNSGAKLLR